MQRLIKSGSVKLVAYLLENEIFSGGADAQPGSPHGRCAIEPRSAGDFYVRTLRPLWYSSFSRLFLAACCFHQSGSAWVASGRLLPGFTGPARPVSRCCGQPGFLAIFAMPFGFIRYPSSRPCLPFGVSATCLIHSRRVFRQTVLTLRSTSLPSVAGRCATKPRSAG